MITARKTIHALNYTFSEPIIKGILIYDYLFLFYIVQQKRENIFEMKKNGLIKMINIEHISLLHFIK